MHIRGCGHAPWALTLAAVACAASPTAAQVVTDGTTGPAGKLDGPDYRIGAELGTRAGGNLFHSFRTFDLAHPESATFTGPAGIDNVISRVTGGEQSDIYGRLSSTIPGADFYFLNPNGVVFGPNATLDVQGSFHVSTADELRFSDGAVFSATDPATGSTFTVAAPEAFGFLGAEPPGVAVDESILEVLPGEAISLVGGDITITAGNNGLASGGEAGTVRAEAGRITLAAVGGPGAAGVASGEINAEASADVRLTDQALVDASGDGGGAVRIRGGQFVVENQSFVFADNDGPTPARDGIAIDAEAVTIGTGSAVTTDVLGSGAGGPLVIQTDDVLVAHGGQIRSVTFGEGDAGTVTVAAERLLVDGDGSGDTVIASQADERSTGGDAGAVTVTADEIELRGGGKISSGTAGEGDAGTVTVAADRVLRIIGAGSEGFTGIASQATERVTGDAGAVTVTAGEIELRARGTISSATFGEGNGGTVTVAADRLRIIGAGPGFFLTGITSSADFFFDTTGELVVPTGDAGSVTVTADEIELRGGGSEINSGTFGEGDAGTVTVAADRVLLADGGNIGSSSVGTGTGKGGSVVVHATETFRSTGGSVTAETVRANAGDVTISAGRLIDLEDSEVTTSAARGKGGGGNIFIDGEFIILDSSDVVARAQEGAGGNISIVADNLFQTPDSLISAASDLGIDGEVMVDAPDVDVTSGLVALPAAFVDASALLRPSCAAGRSEAASSFVGVGRGGVAPGPEDLLAGAYAGLIDAGTGAAAVAEARPRFEPVGLVLACGGED